MKVMEFLEREGVEYERSHHPVTYTARQLANIEHIPAQNVAKPVLVKADGEFVMCVLAANNHLDLQAVRDVLFADHVRLAFEEEMVDVFPECELGAEPPIGSAFGLKTLMDYSLMGDEYIVFQAGTHTESVRMRVSDFDKVAGPVYGTISAD